MFSSSRTRFWVRVPEKFLGTRLPEIPDPALVRILLVDYSKTFDSIDPNILVQKLEALDKSFTLLAWICSFLSSRKQRVKIGNVISSWRDILGNVPQGTLLGTILFLLMINDLRIELPTYKFVDDTLRYTKCATIINIIANACQPYIHLIAIK